MAQPDSNRHAKTWVFEALLQEDGWLAPGCVSVDSEGRTTAIGAEPPAGVPVVKTAGYCVPGFQNAHVHAFQYAMAGMAERLESARDDFWSWRESMYRLASKISPEQMQSVAAMLYAEMLRHGYTSVAEFHYLHHNPDGGPYDNPAEMSIRLAAAAKTAGVQLTLIPIYYRMGDFGKPASARQRRFTFASLDAYWRLWERLRAGLNKDACVKLGVGAHSLRAVAADEVGALFGQAPPATPVHIHIAEQQKEVDGCVAHLGQRPVAWLLDHVDVDRRHTLVHATHMTHAETKRLAASGATVALCPTTEGNLGDGFFPFIDYQSAGGRWAIGSDSNVCLNPAEELRWLDYGQRLKQERRNVLGQRVDDDSGALAIRHSLIGGRAALGSPSSDFYPVSEPFDALVLDANAAVFTGKPREFLLSSLIYAADPSAFLGTVAAGEWVVYKGSHCRGRAIYSDFADAMNALRAS